MSAIPEIPALPTDPPVRRVVVVLGMHRSGTSVVAGCLQRLGVDFGPRLMPPNADNPRGYFEHNDVVNLHDRLLLALDRSWDDPAPFPADWLTDTDRLAPYRKQLLAILRRDFPVAPLWGLKDPRLCRLLPWWETLWPEVASRPLFLLIRRAPAEVAASLARRDGMSTPKADLLWLQHALAAEQSTRSHDRLFLDFADFHQDEHAALEPVRRALGLPPSEAIPATRVVDPVLGQRSTTPTNRELPPWVQGADTALRLGLAGDENAMRATLDGVASQLRAAQPFLFQNSTSAVSDLTQQLAMSRKQARWYEEEWRKAQTRVERLKTQLEKQASHSKTPVPTATSEMINQSYVRKKDLSKLIKSGAADGVKASKLSRIWRIFRGP